MSEKQLIKAENIVVKFGEQEILNFERFSIYAGERVGIVGANGAGKTTLLRVLSGELEPDEGVADIRCDAFFLKQFSEGWRPEELDGKEIKAMKVKNKIWQEKVSGGEDTRIRLAEMFGRDRQLVFLDEPTTNLDIKGIRLLKERLKCIDTMILVSHDRSLLNELCTRIVEISEGKLTEYDGNYDSYIQHKQARVKRQWDEYEQYTAEKKRLEKVYAAKKEKARTIEKKPRKISSSEAKMRAFIALRKPECKAQSMERSAKNVKKRIDHMEVKEKPRQTPSIRPDFRLTDPPENPIVISGENICFAYEDGREIFKDASFRIANGSRVAIVGDNGAGKTTLLSLIADSLSEQKLMPLQSGCIRVVPKASIGMLDQNLAMLEYEKTVLENVMEVSVQKEEVARTILSRLLLSARDMKKKVSVLSGGERIKLAFARLFVDKVNLLILDEPTNFLDIESVEALEEMFSEYEGTLVFVSHDEAFIRAVATDILMVKDGKLERFFGTPEEFFDCQSFVN